MATGNTVVLNIELGGRTKPLQVDQDWSIRKLYDLVAVHMTNADPNTFNLLSDGTILDMKKSVREYHLYNNQTIVYVQRLQGGSCQQLTPLPGLIDLAREPCCMMYDDDPNTLKPRMPCGCVFSQDAIIQYCMSTVDDGDCSFKCPNCSKPWQFFMLRHVMSATMSDEVLNDISKRLDDNFIRRPQQDVRQCAMCSTYSQRDFSRNWFRPTNPNRVVCNVCTKRNGRTVEMCWSCGKEWKGNNKGWCGNGGCGGPAVTLETLATCGTKEIYGVRGVPDTRACPGCGALIYHVEECKHMRCEMCGCNFCFVCLKPQNSEGHWQCGNYDTRCDVAPRQSQLPGTN